MRLIYPTTLSPIFGVDPFFSNDLFTRALRDGVKEVRNFDKMAARNDVWVDPST